MTAANGVSMIPSLTIFVVGCSLKCAVPIADACGTLDALSLLKPTTIAADYVASASAKPLALTPGMRKSVIVRVVHKSGVVYATNCNVRCT